MRRLCLFLLCSLSACGGKGRHDGGPVDGNQGGQAGAGSVDPTCERGINPELDQAITGALSLLAGVTSSAEPRLADIRDLRPHGLKTLSGIQCLPGLVSLQLTDASLADLSPLAGLSSLDELEFYSSATPDIETLGPAAEGLLTLRLINTPFSSLASLAPLQGLESLELRDSKVSSLEALPGLGALRHLVLDANALTRLSGIDRLPMLEDLSVNRNLLQSLSDLGGHLALHHVQAGENQLTTLSDLRLPAAISMSVPANDIAEVGSLGGLSSLVELDLSGNPLTSLAGIGDAQGLQRLRLAATPIVSLGELAVMKDLEELNLYGTTVVSDLSPLSSLMNVKLLTLDDSEVSNLTPLAGWVGLAGACRSVGAHRLALTQESFDVAQQLCLAGWQVAPVCDGQPCGSP